MQSFAAKVAGVRDLTHDVRQIDFELALSTMPCRLLRTMVRDAEKVDVVACVPRVHRTLSRERSD